MINLALVGCGGMANGHAQILQKIPECRVIALCDNVAENAARFKKLYFPEAVEFTDYEKMIAELSDAPADQKLDGVVLVTPHALHYPQCKSALEHGLHVLVEKPMVTSSKHAYDLWKTVKTTGKVFGIAFQAPYTAEYQYLKSIRDSGEWGQVQLVSGWLAQGWKKATEGKWRQDPSLSGGGQMYDSGAHVLNGIMWLMNNPVVEVMCIADKSGTPVDINGVAILKFQNGVLGSITIGGNSPGWSTDVRVQTDKLQVRTGPHGAFLEITSDPKYKYPLVPADSTPAAFTPHRNFVRAILGQEELQSPVRYGVLLSALMDALYESSETQSLVHVKPVPADID